MDCYQQIIDYTDTWSIRWKKMGFLPSCVRFNTTIWMHHMDANETHGEKARWEIHKKTTCYLEQILKAKLNKKLL